MAARRRINATDQGVRVEGLNELNRALRQMGGPELQKELKEAGKTVAEKVASDARTNAMSLGGVAAKVAPSIKASARNTGAGVRFGGAKYPFAGGAEFGSLQFKQFKPWRGNTSDAGYFLYPSIRSNSDTIADEYLSAVEDLARRNGLL